MLTSPTKWPNYNIDLGYSNGTWNGSTFSTQASALTYRHAWTRGASVLRLIKLLHARLTLASVAGIYYTLHVRPRLFIRVWGAIRRPSNYAWYVRDAPSTKLSILSKVPRTRLLPPSPVTLPALSSHPLRPLPYSPPPLGNTTRKNQNKSRCRRLGQFYYYFSSFSRWRHPQ